MRGTRDVAEFLVVARPMVLVLDQQTDRRSQGDAIFNAAEDADLVAFLARGRQVALAWTAPVQLGLDVEFGQGQPRRAAGNDRADSGAVRFTKGGDAENGAKGI